VNIEDYVVHASENYSEKARGNIIMHAGQNAEATLCFAA